MGHESSSSEWVDSFQYEWELAAESLDRKIKS
jgi:hypothetical protein